MIGRNSKNPKYMKIKEELRKKILSERLAPGTQMPSEPEIARKYAVSPMTARRALSELALEGYVVREQGRGTFVAQVKKYQSKSAGRISIRYILVGRKATDPAYSSLWQHLVHTASDSDADLICSELSVKDDSSNTQQALHDLLLHTDVNGGIIITGETTEEQILEVQHSGIPFVLAGTTSDHLSHACDWVSFDYRDSASQLVEHLVSFGHQRIGLIIGGITTGWPVFLHSVASQEVREGYLMSLARHSISFDERYIRAVDNLIDPSAGRSGRSAAQRLLSLRDNPTAIIAMSNRLAVGVLDFLKPNKLSVPGDISLASLGDFAPAREAQPPITIIGFDYSRYARDIIQLLIKRIHDKRVQGKSVEPVGLRLKGHLIVRKSTAPFVTH